MEKARVAIVAAAMALALIIGAGASAAPENAYTVTNLVSDQAGVAAHQDPSLVNAWGLTARATSPWWVADNGTDVATLYGAAGTKFGLTVGVASAPTGAVATQPGTSSFPIAGA